MVKVSQQAVGKWEKSLSEPDSETLIELTKIFQVSLSYLIRGEEEEPLLQKKEIIKIPDKYSDVYVALNGGDDDLTQDDVDAIVRFIEFTKNNKK